MFYVFSCFRFRVAMNEMKAGKTASVSPIPSIPFHPFHPPESRSWSKESKKAPLLWFLLLVLSYVDSEQTDVVRPPAPSLRPTFYKIVSHSSADLSVCCGAVLCCTVGRQGPREPAAYRRHRHGGEAVHVLFVDGHGQQEQDQRGPH